MDEKIYGTKHLITESKFFDKKLIRQIPILDIKEINFVKVNGGNNTPRYFITRFFMRIADLLFTLFDGGGEAGLGSINKDYFEIKYMYEEEEVHSIFETVLKEGDIKEMRSQILNLKFT